MNPIDKIIISCYKYDIDLLRICVASIRFWHPKVPIGIIPDYAAGKFSLQELIDFWNVEVIELERTEFGSCLSKLEIFFLEPSLRLLYVDSDVIFAGDVLSALQNDSSDFIVSPSRIENLRDQHIKEVYWDPNLLLEFDPTFSYPGYVFNAGQMVVTSGIIKRNDFLPVIDWRGGRPKNYFPNIFLNYDQSFLNYLFAKLCQLRKISVGTVDFKIFATHDNLKKLNAHEIRNKAGVPKVIHFAGEKFPVLSMMPGADLLNFFEGVYYGSIPFGALKRYWRRIFAICRWLPSFTAKRVYAAAPDKVKAAWRLLRGRLSKLP